MPLSCSQGLADSVVIAKVNDQLWDLDRPLEGDSSLKLLKFDDPDGKDALLWRRFSLSWVSILFCAVTLTVISIYLLLGFFLLGVTFVFQQ